MAIEICDLTVEFRTGGQVIAALQKLNLSVAQGEVYGFIGPNGAGKTTTMHVLLGFIAATSGTATIFGEDVRRSIARRRIGYMPENPQMYRFLTGRELLVMAGRLFGLRGNLLSRKAAELIDLVNLSAAADRRIAGYSRGMMQRIALAQALVNDPDLIILDEPTGGFDPIGRIGIREIIAGLRAAGKTVFFSSHELSEVEQICDRVGIIAKGRLIADGHIAQLVKAGESLEQYFLRILT
ncbi:MAG: ABC transporter ATP-binding protein [Kiritimatiellia bacterium]|nr:ABC transporter ATP-binding protein [Kiritimatiellia bacterium]